MRRSPLTASLKLGLAVAVLAASAMPPAIRHAHPGGDRPHRHTPANHQHAVDHHSHAHEHGNSTETHRHREEPTAAASGLAARPHLHLTLLGLEVTFPVSGREQPELPETPADGGATVVVRLFDDPAVGAEPSSRAGHTVPADADTSLPERRPASSERLSFASLPPPWPLCDSARGERSGVQVI